MEPNKRILFFIGEKQNEREIFIKEKPSFYDALLLSKVSLQPPESSSYQSIPLGDITKVLICFQENNSHQQSLTLTEEAIYNLLNHFIVKEGSKTSYLVNFSDDKIKRIKKKKQRISAVGKEIGR